MEGKLAKQTSYAEDREVKLHGFGMSVILMESGGTEKTGLKGHFIAILSTPCVTSQPHY